MADTIVLTINAKKVTVREEDGSRSSARLPHNPRERESPSSNQRFFFSKMWVMAGNHQVAASFTYTQLSAKSVHVTLTRTQFT
jgi:hypothetical protein